MSENAPTRSLDDIDLAALRVSIVVIKIRVLHFIHVTYGRRDSLDVMSYDLKRQFASDTSTTIQHPRNKS